MANLGYTTIGGTFTGALSSGFNLASRATLAVDDQTFTTWFCYLRNASSSPQDFYGCVWADSGGVLPGALIAATSLQTLAGSASAGWKSAAISATNQDSGDYWIGFSVTGSDAAGLEVAFDAGGFDYYNTGGTPPIDPFGFGSSDTNTISAYIALSGAAGPVNDTPAAVTGQGSVGKVLTRVAGTWH